MLVTKKPRISSVKSLKGANSSITLKQSFKRFYSDNAEEHFVPRKYGHGKKGRKAQEAELQMKQDNKVQQKEIPQTGPGSGSARSRTVEESQPRYPTRFLVKNQHLERDSKEHLEALQKHFSDSLGSYFSVLIARSSAQISLYSNLLRH